MKKYNDYLGIDISKKTFDTVNKKGDHYQYSNDKKGFKSFYKTIAKDSLFVMEATGIYHLELAKFLHTEGAAVCVENPLRIKRFGQMHMKRSKTDKADARTISLYAQQQSVKQWTPAPKVIEQSNDIYQVMEQHIEFRAGLKNKLSSLKSKKASKSLIQLIEYQIVTISVSIEKLEGELEELSKSYDSKMLSNIKSIVGIGKRTAILLMISTEGFHGFDNAKQLISYFGLAPIEYSSGSSIRKKSKISKMGNPLVRKKLFMCSLQASRYNKNCAALYQRLLAKGKPKKLALIAVANKLLKIVFAIAKSGIPYDREYRSFIALK